MAGKCCAVGLWCPSIARHDEAMAWLILLILFLITGFDVLLDPVVRVFTPIFALKGWIWLPLIAVGWLLAGRRS